MGFCRKIFSINQKYFEWHIFIKKIKVAHTLTAIYLSLRLHPQEEGTLSTEKFS